VNEVGGDANGPILIQRQSYELGPVLAVRCSYIDGAGAASGVMFVNG
jgi:hypothetical protein